MDDCVADARKAWGEANAADLTREASIVVLKRAQGEFVNLFIQTNQEVTGINGYSYLNFRDSTECIPESVVLASWINAFLGLVWPVLDHQNEFSLFQEFDSLHGLYPQSKCHRRAVLREWLGVWR